MRQRQSIQRKITGAKNKLRRLLSDHNLDRPDLFTKAGQAALAEMKLVVQAAWQLVKRSPRWKAIDERLKVRIGGKKAVIAVSRRLLGVCFSVLKSQRDYCEKELPQTAAA